jgi:uncharacterized paraquat-inducible protein A
VLAQAGDGPNNCPHCGGEFEARIFRPASRRLHVVQLAQSGPEAAGACSNHPRNAAVTTCARCGIFICSLCELDVDDANYCPACFERLAQEGSIPSARVRFRDYGSLAILASFVGLVLSFVLGLPLGVLTLYYVYKGFRTRRESGAPVTGLVLAAIVALIDMGFGSILLVSLFMRHK